MTLVKYKRINCNRAISGLSGNLLALLCVWASAFVVIAPTNGLLYLLIAPVALLKRFAQYPAVGVLVDEFETGRYGSSVFRVSL
jgi:hypothetical protein